MKTSHIRNVVLYAKNFYVHTGNVVKDMQRFMQLDGHPYKTIDTAEKVQAVMKADYIEFVNSLEDKHDISRLMRSADEGVMWAEGPEKYIWNYLIIYSGSTIPMSSKYLGYPTYDKYHLPQKSLSDVDFKSCKNFSEMVAVAKEVLDRKQDDEFDRYMNNLLVDTNWERVLKILSDVNGEKDANKKDLKNELWEEYENFMDEYLDDNDNMKSGFSNRKSKHFLYGFGSANEGVQINTYLIAYKQSYSSPKSETSRSDVFNQLIADEDNNRKSVEIANKCNEVLGYEEFYEPSTAYEGAIRCHKAMMDDICVFKDNCNDPIIIGCGSHAYFVYEEDGMTKLDVYLTCIDTYAIKEQELWSPSNIVDSERW